MKKYKKYTGKLLQIRLADDEYKSVDEFIKKFKVTKREWILGVVNHLRSTKVLREGTFWESDKDFAYANAHRYDKQFTEDSKCEKCGAGHCADSERGTKQLERHHYKGYEGDNAFKVKILCRPCHWDAERKKGTYKKIT